MNAHPKFLTCPSYVTPTLSPTWGGHFHSHEDDSPDGKGLAIFKYSFKTPKDLQKLTLEATSLGIFELYINGVRVGTPSANGTLYDELKPGNTDYRQTVFSCTFDLTSYLEAQNTLYAVVAPGWWAGRISFNAFGTNPVAFAAELHFQNNKGKVETISADETWSSSVGGPIRYADIWDGTTIDATIPEPWEAASNLVWEKPTTFSYEGTVKPFMGPAVRIQKQHERKPLSAWLYKDTVDNGTTYGKICPRFTKVGTGCEKTTIRPGEHLLLDLGQNMVGRPQVVLHTARNAKVRIQFAEMLNDSGAKERGNDGPEGSLYVMNYRDAIAQITYYANGAPEETIEPLFTFFGFRYLEIIASEPCEVFSVRGIVLASDLEELGHLETDNAEVNQLISNIEWGRRSNYLSIPTDCPQRNERLGWSGDTQVFAGAASYLSDTRGFLRKYLHDLADAQPTTDGRYPNVAPHVLPYSNAGIAGWGDAGIIIPNVLYTMYGDREIIREQYESMEWHMRALDALTPPGPGRMYGDWLCYEETSKDFISLAYYVYDVDLMAKYSHILSEDANDFYAQRARHYEEQAKALRCEFQKTYIQNEDLTERTQTTYLLTLRFHLAPKELEPQLLEHLIQKLEANDYTLSTGFLGTSILEQTLSEFHRDDLAYSLLLQTRDPSWLYSVRQGATTVWERWNSYTKERGFGDVRMNSFNHYAYGVVLEWMFSGMAGIKPDSHQVGFEHLILSPRPDTRTTLPEGQERIKRLKASYKSVKGEIRSAWYYVQNVFTYECTVPEGITATIEFPLIIDGKAISQKEQIIINDRVYTIGELCGTIHDGCAVFELPAGTYKIS